MNISIHSVNEKEHSYEADCTHSHHCRIIKLPRGTQAQGKDYQIKVVRKEADTLRNEAEIDITRRQTKMAFSPLLLAEFTFHPDDNTHLSYKCPVLPTDHVTSANKRAENNWRGYQKHFLFSLFSFSYYYYYYHPSMLPLCSPAAIYRRFTEP